MLGDASLRMPRPAGAPVTVQVVYGFRNHCCAFISAISKTSHEFKLVKCIDRVVGHGQHPLLPYTIPAYTPALHNEIVTTVT